MVGKLESVYSDATSHHLQACVCALGIIFQNITGPFWRMFHSDLNRADLQGYNKIIQKMHKCFQLWSVDSSELLTLSCKGIFDNFYVVKSNYLIF